MSIDERRAIEAKTGIESPGRFRVHIGEVRCGTRLLQTVGVLMLNGEQVATIQDMTVATELSKVLEHATKTWCETKL